MLPRGRDSHARVVSPLSEGPGFTGVLIDSRSLLIDTYKSLSNKIIVTLRIAKEEEGRKRKICLCTTCVTFSCMITKAKPMNEDLFSLLVPELHQQYTLHSILSSIDPLFPSWRLEGEA